jgi:hypothetical protein
MNKDNKPAGRPKLETTVGAASARAIKADTARRTAARKAYRAKIESLLEKSADESLADVWQRVCPFAVDPACEFPNRRGIIRDLADFAEVLRPSLEGMKAHRLCRLIEKYAACGPRPSELPVSRLA